MAKEVKFVLPHLLVDKKDEKTFMIDPDYSYNLCYKVADNAWYIFKSIKFLSLDATLLHIQNHICDIALVFEEEKIISQKSGVEQENDG
ncbi:hypothetical protein [Photorhabdus bodei]|uniref:Uncharacterized protein n=1 Tax=Photorhabdus bodei TaxID=2029681 RepID=A0AAW6BMI3_9GAMM|nr:hypothetical protein [Photorhabdus bodei]MDB6373855.1 hypothetical protein [Photorhabdus bodei]